jgi:uncharacterized protein (TIGR02757 family)
VCKLTRQRLRELRTYLDSVYDRYHRPELIATDPLSVARGVTDPDERELVGLVAGWFSSGRASSIIDGAKRAVAMLTLDGREPLKDVVRAASFEDLRSRLEGFRYRWLDPTVLAASLEAVGVELKRSGVPSVVGLLARDDNPEHPNLLPALTLFVSRLEDRAQDRLQTVGAQENQSRALRWLWSNPARGGASKRWMMWLRWFVRHDAIDPGGHEYLGPHRLVMPLDVHVFRLVRYMRLTRYRTASQKAAVDVTQSFLKLVPSDPLRYDFALSRIGILGHCPGRRSRTTCSDCSLFSVCRA